MANNRNYISGRSWEYQVKKVYEKLGYTVIRAAGSHGAFDLIALRANSSVLCIQCKRVSTRADAIRLENHWRENPPFPPGAVKFTQVLEIKLKGSKLQFGVAV